VTGQGRSPDERTALARLYDLDFVEDPGDIDFYLALAQRTGGPVLELGVGTGRIAVPLAAAGFDVTGVDVDAAMLDRARARAADTGLGERVRLVEADIVDLELPEIGAFRLAFLALNSLMLLGTREAQRGALRTAARHLAPGGLAAVDVWLPDADDLARFDGRVILEYAREDPETGLLVTKAGSAQHDNASQVVTLTTMYEESAPGGAVQRWLRMDRLRLVSADELRTLAHEAGLDVETIAGGYDLAPLGPGSDRAVLVAVRTGPSR
jgi:SAM-dependent methyltransferase